MKSSTLLPLWAVAGVAYSPIHQYFHNGTCLLEAPSLLLGIDPMCGLDSSASTNLRSSAGSPWKYAAPCNRSKKNGREYCVYSDPTFAGGRGAAFVTWAGRAAYLARKPAFTDGRATEGMNLDPGPKYKVVPMEGKGMGIVATRLINRGELIMASTASLMIDYGAFDDLDRDEYMQLQEEAAALLPWQHRDQLFNLSTHDEASTLAGPELVDKVISTNAFDIYPPGDDDDPDPDQSAFYTVFPEVARLNHDCRANADYRFDHAALAQLVHAVRPILPGEEITISYIDPLIGRARRAKRLRSTWGFECGCAACRASGAAAAASDARVAQLGELARELDDYGPGSRATPQMAELYASLLEMEGLWGMVYWGYWFAAIEWNGVGEPWVASKWAHMAVEYGIYSAGPRDRKVVDMVELAEDPWAHWSWMSRTTARQRGSSEKDDE